jgi:hypothetical protein
MATGIRRISLAVRGLVGRVVGSRVLAPVVPVVRVALVEPEDPVVPAIVLAEPLVLAIVPAAAQAPAIVLAEALVLIIVLAEARVPATVLAAVRALVIAPVEAVPVRSHLRARLAVPLRTKSVIALHHRGQVPLLAAVEDLAAVAEIMRAQAATEAVKAWEVAAVTAVAAAAE